MFVTPDFVFVHLPKTGGSFVLDALKNILCPSTLEQRIHALQREWSLRLPVYRYRYREWKKRHFCSDIPELDSEKPIVSCIRNPLKLYVSEFTFGWWRRNPDRWFADLKEVEQVQPEWRGMPFEEFLTISSRHASWVRRAALKYPEAERLGWYSHKFIYYYTRDPDFVFEAAGDPDLLVTRARQSMYPVQFLNTDTLNRHLYDFLRSCRYPREKIDFILAKRKVNVSNGAPKKEWYPDSLRRQVEERDALIFRLFPEFTQ